MRLSARDELRRMRRFLSGDFSISDSLPARVPHLAHRLGGDCARARIGLGTRVGVEQFVSEACEVLLLPCKRTENWFASSVCSNVAIFSPHVRAFFGSLVLRRSSV